MMEPKGLEPRGFWDAFGVIAVVGGILMTALWHFVSGAPLIDSMFFGAFWGIGMAAAFAYSLTGITEIVQFKSRKAFIARLNVLMAQVKYFPVAQTDTYLTYLPGTTSGSASISLGPLSIPVGGALNDYALIFVQLEARSATIVGPRLRVTKLKEALQKETL